MPFLFTWQYQSAKDILHYEIKSGNYSFYGFDTFGGVSYAALSITLQQTPAFRPGMSEG